MTIAQLIGKLETYYKKKYTEPQRKVIGQYLQRIAEYGLPHLEAELYLRYATLPMTSQIHGGWVSIRETIYKPATNYQQIPEETEQYAPKEEVVAFLKELRDALDPHKPDEMRENALAFLRTMY